MTPTVKIQYDIWHIVRIFMLVNNIHCRQTMVIRIFTTLECGQVQLVCLQSILFVLFSRVRIFLLNCESFIFAE